MRARRRSTSSTTASVRSSGTGRTASVSEASESAPSEGCSGRACARLFSRYQAIVRSSPSRSVVCARKPKSSSARDASSCRRGWPFGFDVSQTISPVEAGQLGDELGELADRRSRRRCRGSPARRRRSARPRARAPRRSRRRRGTRASASRRPRARPRSVASTIFRISAGITCDVSRSKLSRGP